MDTIGITKSHIRRYFREYFIINSTSVNKLITVEWTAGVANELQAEDIPNKVNVNHHLFTFKHDENVRQVIRAAAKCNKEDTFDEEFGIELALAKCYLKLIEYRYRVWKKVITSVCKDLDFPESFIKAVVEDGLNNIKYHKSLLNKILYKKYPELRPM